MTKADVFVQILHEVTGKPVDEVRSLLDEITATTGRPGSTWNSERPRPNNCSPIYARKRRVSCAGSRKGRRPLNGIRAKPDAQETLDKKPES